MPDFSLANQIAVVTGASSGLGAHFARLLAEAGAKVALLARRKRLAEEIAAEIDHDGGRATPGQTVVVQDDRPGQDADDAEADREVAEAAHRAEQLLRVAELVQVRDVLFDDVVAGCRLCHRILPHSTEPPIDRWAISAGPPSVSRPTAGTPHASDST
jgi:NAD(P)-dependent dehydrogenase (short-subunit alcohol dehydrogenase family)